MENKEEFRLKVTAGDLSIEVTGNRDAIKVAKELMEFLRTMQVTDGPKLKTTEGRIGVIDIRSFFDEKKPRNHREAAACVAYYYQYLAPVEERRENIDTELLEKGFKLAKRKLPKAITQLLIDTKSAGYLDSVSKGTYKLNTIGYNLVEHTLGGAEAS
jgi:hypothetical protein